MDVLIKLEVGDWLRFQSHIEKELAKNTHSWITSFWFNLVLWTALAFIFMFVFQNAGYFHWPTAGVVAIFFIIFITLFVLKLSIIRKASAPSDNGVFVGEHQFNFDADGIKTKGHGYEASHSWSIVKRIERTNGMILIYLDTVYAYVLPENKLSDPDLLYNYLIEKFKK